MTISCLPNGRENKAETDTWILHVLQRVWCAKSKKTQIYIYVISNVIIYNLFIILFYVFLLCSLIL